MHNDIVNLIQSPVLTGGAEVAYLFWPFPSGFDSPPDFKILIGVLHVEPCITKCAIPQMDVKPGVLSASLAGGCENSTVFSNEE